MGLMIHSLGELPTNVERGYYIYLLDYGWDEPLGKTLRRNFDRMAALASTNDAVVMQGVVGTHFADEVLSWHSINGQPGDDILPAILITTRHPQQFHGESKQRQSKHPSDRMVLIPLKKACTSSTDVVKLIEKVFRDIKEKKQLTEFEVARELSSGKHGALVDALILEPNIGGIGLNLNYIINFLMGRNRE